MVFANVQGTADLTFVSNVIFLVKFLTYDGDKYLKSPWDSVRKYFLRNPPKTDKKIIKEITEKKKNVSACEIRNYELMLWLSETWICGLATVIEIFWNCELNNIQKVLISKTLQVLHFAHRKTFGYFPFFWLCTLGAFLRTYCRPLTKDNNATM